ncbi:hypothetical protein GCM10010232_70100 [Streptomyces amakusaensis]|uniref:Uncharacterized protein n=1 Tax=Streptomyces amakusaensis TaxID=67271 RepID=A0ABW0ATF2_9ACTN
MSYYHQREQARRATAERLRATRKQAAAVRAAVRDRARGMTRHQAATVLEQFAGQSAAPGSPLAAQWSEWSRIHHALLLGGGTYDPDTDPDTDVLAERANQAILAAAHRTAGRVAELETLALTGQLSHERPQDGDDALLDRIRTRSWDAGQALGTWLAQALADRSGCYADPAARAAATVRLPDTVVAQADLLAALAATGVLARGEELPFAGRLAAVDPDAAADLARWLTQALADRARGTDSGPG